MFESQVPTPLILRAQAGDRRALEELFRGIQRPLHDYLAQLVGNTHFAEDILQEVFVLTWRKLPWLRDPLLFRPWIIRIASREAFRRLKKERTWRQWLGGSDPDPIAREAPLEPITPEGIDQLDGYLAAVSPASRVVLVLHYRQGLTLEEIADVLDLPKGTVKSRLAFGLSTLRRMFRTEEAPREG